MSKHFLSMADIEETVKNKIYEKCQQINGNFYPCGQLAKTFDFADIYPFNDIPKIMKEISPVCPYCEFRFNAPWNGIDLEKTPWAFIPDDCEKIRIYHDGSWKTHHYYMECRGLWKNCPKELRPQNGGEYVVHSRPVK